MSQTKCPICEDPYTVQGLYGHLRFSHELDDGELQDRYQQAISEKEEPDLFNGEADEGQEAEDDEPDDLPSAPTQDQAKKGQAKDEPFDWKRRLRRLQSLRPKVEAVDQSGPMGWFRRDQGAQEAISALEKIEMEVREQIGAPGQDRELRQSVDKSLNLIEGLTDCRTQREAIEERFDGEEADKRAQRLSDREAEIRLYIRDQWNVGKPVDELPESDDLLDAGEEKSNEDSGGPDWGDGAYGLPISEGAASRAASRFIRKLKS
jgi:hypothetical protein